MMFTAGINDISAVNFLRKKMTENANFFAKNCNCVFRENVL